MGSMCGSGNQAAIAASMASTEAQQAAVDRAFAFSKEQFDYMKGLRKPYTDAGASATGMLMNLLGLNPVLGKDLPGAGTGPVKGGVLGSGGGTLSSLVGAAGGSGSGGSGSAGATGAGGDPGGAFGGPKFPNGVPLFDVGRPGFEHPVPGNQPTLDPVTGQPTFTDLTGVYAGGDPTGLPALVPGHSGTGMPGMVNVVDPKGQQRSVPSSLVSFYAAKGWQV